MYFARHHGQGGRHASPLRTSRNLTLLLGVVHVPAGFASTQVYVQFGSPAPFVTPVPVAPVAYGGFVWQPGHYVWTRFGYRWVPGGWVRPAYGYRGFVPNRWERERRDWDRDRYYWNRREWSRDRRDWDRERRGDWDRDRRD